jgi:hypothetical protein
MARKVLHETGYVFTPSTRTIVLKDSVPRERLVLITNVTTNQVIYNFSDPSLKATSYTSVIDSTNNASTTIVLNYNTANMTATDKLQVVIDEYAESFAPDETYMDPVGKLRVSMADSLIDTDFEYGSQPTKWESLALTNNKPSVYADTTAPVAMPSGGVNNFISITGTGSSRLVTAVTELAHGLSVGDEFVIQDTLDPNADGWYTVRTVATTTVANDTFTYYAKGNVAASNVLDDTRSYAYRAYRYSASSIPVATTSGGAFVASGTTVTVTTTHAHGLSIGDLIYVKGTTSASNPPNGAWEVRTTPTTNTFTYLVIDAPSGAITATATSLFGRPGALISHRPFDGGVRFTTGSSAPGSKVIRQTRRYFRYQSGKGVQFSTGSALKPNMPVDLITSVGTTVTVKTRYEHFLGIGASVIISGCDQEAYNGTFLVTAIVDNKTFRFTSSSVPSSSPATGFPISVAPTTWFGGQNRLGMFDEQNGVFYEYDGQKIYACRKSSVDQIAGIVSATFGSPTITGTDTRFAEQLSPGDSIVIRGQSYLVASITSNTQMFIYPEYRGRTITAGGIVSKTVTLKVPQEEWNIDKMDGTGPSGHVLDLSKMQMFYIDYSWYGAGAIRFGFKDDRGEVIYCHRMTHANVKTEAYMRSGNLPARYESASDPASTKLSASLSSSATSMTVDSTEGFPTAGILSVTAAGNTAQAIEYVRYTGKTPTTFTGLTRGRTDIIINNVTGGTGGGAAAQNFTYSATAPVKVELYTREFAPGTSHWGSSVIMDGGYDDDKSFVFQTGMRTGNTVATGSPNTDFALLSLRLAPSVDNGVVGVLGQREIINRMQLTLEDLGVLAESSGTAPGKFLVKVILNGRPSVTKPWQNVGGSSLSQFINHASGETITGGESIYSFFISTVRLEAEVITASLERVRDLGNSILGGGVSLNYDANARENIYPDGPDVITIAVSNLGSVAGVVNARLGWKEAQA